MLPAARSSCPRYFSQEARNLRRWAESNLASQYLTQDSAIFKTPREFCVGTRKPLWNDTDQSTRGACRPCSKSGIFHKLRLSASLDRYETHENHARSFIYLTEEYLWARRVKEFENRCAIAWMDGYARPSCMPSADWRRDPMSKV